MSDKLNLINVDDTSFDEVVKNSSVPVLVEFGASWCGPCQRQLPILQEIASQYKEKIKVVKIDIDDANKISNLFYIRSVPTIILFDKGEVINTKIGLSSEKNIKEMLDNFIK